MAWDQSEKVHIFQNFLNRPPTSWESIGESTVASTPSGGFGGTFEIIVVLLGLSGGGRVMRESIFLVCLWRSTVLSWRKKSASTRSFYTEKTKMTP